MISRAIEIDPGSSSRDGESLLQSPSASAVAHLGAGEPRRLGDLAVAEEELLLRVADRVEADHQRPRERPRLTAQVRHVGDVRPISSATSRTTHPSKDSPASTNPAMSEKSRSGHTV